MLQRSKKGQARYAAKNAMYAEMDSEREHVCTGCGRNDCLSHSHLIPVSVRPDLEAVKENCTYHCIPVDGSQRCHDLWAGNLEKKKQLLDFEQNMEYIKVVDLQYYNKIMNG